MFDILIRGRFFSSLFPNIHCVSQIQNDVPGLMSLGINILQVDQNLNTVCIKQTHGTLILCHVYHPDLSLIDNYVTGKCLNIIKEVCTSR